MRIAAAAALYFFIVFGTGLALGPIRVLWLEPLVGPTIAVVCEAPALLAVIVIASRWVPAFVRLPLDLGPLALMGGAALALQQIADFIVGIGLRGMSATEQLAQFGTIPGLIYAVLLLIFALMPLLANFRLNLR